MSKHMKVTKKVQIALGFTVAGLLLGACGSSSESTESTDAAIVSDCPAADIVDAATAEAKVNLIALPDTWANYKGIWGMKKPPCRRRERARRRPACARE